ncbi:MAG TPA: response regulator [Candidatus Binataceae bacterium]|nr:response regulator [Candidatus Binataceae bacterium]HVC45235.1 response regulator [Candidatus Binataceae bacterium]
MRDKESGATPGVSAPPDSQNPADGAAVKGDAPVAAAVLRTVLVVEDDPDTQAFMVALLGRHYQVATAASEFEFWREVEQRAASLCLILMDLSLRGSEDGLTLTRQFRAEARWNAIPVVALTAHATTEDRERALAAGCAVYVSKPVDRRRLLEVINSLITP